MLNIGYKQQGLGFPLEGNPCIIEVLLPQHQYMSSLSLQCSRLGVLSKIKAVHVEALHKLFDQCRRGSYADGQPGRGCWAAGSLQQIQMALGTTKHSYRYVLVQQHFAHAHKLEQDCGSTHDLVAALVISNGLFQLQYRQLGVLVL